MRGCFLTEVPLYLSSLVLCNLPAWDVRQLLGKGPYPNLQKLCIRGTGHHAFSSSDPEVLRARIQHNCPVLEELWIEPSGTTPYDSSTLAVLPDLPLLERIGCALEVSRTDSTILLPSALRHLHILQINKLTLAHLADTDMSALKTLVVYDDNVGYSKWASERKAINAASRRLERNCEAQQVEYWQGRLCNGVKPADRPYGSTSKIPELAFDGAYDCMHRGTIPPEEKGWLAQAVQLAR